MCKRRLHPDLLTAASIAGRYCVRPGDYGYRVWRLTEASGWIIAAERLADRDVARDFILARLGIEEPKELRIVAKPADAYFDPGDFYGI